MVEDLIHCGWVQTRLMIEEVVIAILIPVFVEADDGQDVLHIICTGHMPRIPTLRGQGHSSPVLGPFDPSVLSC
jgi:hypothetical protein